MNTGSQAAFRALADPTRRGILAILATGDKTIGEVADRFEITRPAVKKHLTILEKGNLIDVVPRGRERINKLNAKGLLPVLQWLELFDAFWDERLIALKTAIENEDDNT